jgi:hypothetical protein
MSTPKVLWLTDRSRIQAYHNCKRLRYLNYHWGGRGLERVTLGLPLINGTFIHAAFAAVLTGDSAPSVLARLETDYRASITARGVYAENNTEDFILEQLTLLKGLVLAWDAVRLPALRAEYEVVAVEQEMQWAMAPGLIDMVRCDAILRRKSDGLLFILEFKTVSSVTNDWLQQWQHNSQILANSLAVEELYGQPVGGVLIEGIVKGRRTIDRGTTSPFHGQQIQQSPLCYGYRRRTETGYDYDVDWNRGSEKVAIWEHLPIEDWVFYHLTEADRNALFVTLPAHLPVRREQERWRRQTVAQEHQIQTDLRVLETTPDDDQRTLMRDVMFPLNDDHCFRYFGHPCSFEPLCFTQAIEDDPLGSGLYQPRTPHHPTEAAEVEK